MTTRICFAVGILILVSAVVFYPRRRTIQVTNAVASPTSRDLSDYFCNRKLDHKREQEMLAAKRIVYIAGTVTVLERRTDRMMVRTEDGHVLWMSDEYLVGPASGRGRW